jgi:hydroxypyruvate isomerase
MDPFTIALGAKGLSGLFTGISKVQQGKAEAKQIMANATAQRDQVLQEGHDAVENQNNIASALGYSLSQETSNFKVLVETEAEAKRQANIIMENARRAAAAAKKSGVLGGIGSVFGAVGDMAGMSIGK